MKKVKAARSSNPASPPEENRWIEKRKAILENLATRRGAFHIAPEDLAGKKAALLLEVERLEEENHTMARSAKEFEFQLSKKTRIFRAKLNGNDDLKRKQVRLSTRENSLHNEMALYESEQVRLTEVYTKTSKNLKENIAALKEIIDRIAFTKGETQSLTEKLTLLEGDIPAKNNEVSNMDEIITNSIGMLKRFSNRMRRIEKDLTVNYYEKKQQARE